MGMGALLTSARFAEGEARAWQRPNSALPCGG